MSNDKTTADVAGVSVLLADVFFRGDRDPSYQAAIHRLRETIRAAHTARVPIAHIAADAGVTRQTVYRWLRDDAS